jgi:hypothetical protein
MSIGNSCRLRFNRRSSALAFCVPDPRHLTNVAADKRSADCAGLRPALLFDSLAAELGR